MQRTAARLVGLLMLCAGAGAAAEVTIGVSLPLTGPASSLGVPVRNGFALWPTEIAGQKLNLIVLDDASDPTTANQNARRFVSSDRVDLIVGSAMTPAALAMAGVAAEARTPQIAVSPVELPPGKDAWTFRIAHSTAVMALALADHMRRQGVRTLGFLGYNDAYGESWLRDIGRTAAQQGIRLVATERFARTDTSANAQALKLVLAKPDAVLVVASGSGAAMPHKALIERGYRGRIYQTHSAASRDLVRVGGKDVEGAFVVSGPAVVAEQLPEGHPCRSPALDFVQRYEKLNGPDSRNQFAAHTYDAMLILRQVLPVALQTAKPGTDAFRAALREALESSAPIALSQGVLQYTEQDHFGFQPQTGVILRVVDGDWRLERN